MEQAEKARTLCKLTAPLSGQVVPLDQVPDPTFAEKILGDGVAILPEAGRIYSPVNGEVSSVAATKHAFGFTSEDGLEVLVHVGLETVSLKGEGFTVHVKEGGQGKGRRSGRGGRSGISAQQGIESDHTCADL